MEISNNLAEIAGLLMGDGCLSKYSCNGKIRKEIAFTGNITEFEYYSNFVQPTFKKHFGVKGYLFKRDNNSTRYHIVSEKAFNFFKELGIPVGKKSKILIPTVIKEDISKGVHFVRGLFDAEGSIYKRYSKRYKGHSKVYDHLLTLQIRMNDSLDIIEFIEKLCEVHNITTNRITKEKKAYVLRITQQNSIKKFLKIIKPRIKNGLVAQFGQ